MDKNDTGGVIRAGSGLGSLSARRLSSKGFVEVKLVQYSIVIPWLSKATNLLLVTRGKLSARPRDRSYLLSFQCSAAPSH